MRPIVLAALLAPSLALASAPPIPAPPPVPAEGYILVDYTSGRVLAAQEPEERFEPASITKLMTAYVAFAELAQGRLSMDEQVRISTRAWSTEGSRMFVEERSLVTVDELLHGIIVQSGNDASVALAEHIAGTEEAFADYMNSYGQHLGLTGTHFANATGLPHPEHYTTAQDIATLSAALVREYPQYYGMFAITEYTYNGIRQHNRNALLFRDDSVDGLKTGHTESAGYCLAATARRDGQRLIAVVLRSRDESARNDAAATLLDYGFRWFDTHLLYPAGGEVTRIRVWKGAAEEVALGPLEDVHVTIPRGRYELLEARMDLVTEVVAPVEAGAALGTVVVTLDGEVVAEVPLVPLAPVPEGNLWQMVRDAVLLWFE